MMEGRRPHLTTKAQLCPCADGWHCAQHPDQPWPHDDCAGPGMPCLRCQPDADRQPDDNQRLIGRNLSRDKFAARGCPQNYERGRPLISTSSSVMKGRRLFF